VRINPEACEVHFGKMGERLRQGVMPGAREPIFLIPEIIVMKNPG
jgi:hypothetical protein